MLAVFVDVVDKPCASIETFCSDLVLSLKEENLPQNFEMPSLSSLFTS